jgi:regulator of sirC expression with transglutaminase-like and TPR domain
VKRRSALALLLSAACSPDRSAAENAPLTRRLLAAGESFGEGNAGQRSTGLAELLRVSGVVTQARPRHGSLLLALNATVFRTLGFVREVNDRNPAFMFLPSVLASRRGGCVGLGLLYLSLAELLALPLECILRPGHLYVRMRRPEGHVNVELLREGEAMPDDWYENRFPIAGGTAPAYGRPLSNEELFGVIAYNVGIDRQTNRRLSEARSAFERATRAFPDFAEAHASLGRTLHLLGALDSADAAYAAAQRVNPALPGLADNVVLLRNERRSSLAR